MAVTVETTILHDGPRNTVVHLNLTAAGAGDLPATVAVDVSALAPSAVGAKVKRAQWAVSEGVVNITYDNWPDDDLPLLAMSGQGAVDWCSIGGAPNKGVAPTGDLMVSTAGFGGAASVSLELRKKL